MSTNAYLDLRFSGTLYLALVLVVIRSQFLIGKGGNFGFQLGGIDYKVRELSFLVPVPVFVLDFLVANRYAGRHESFEPSSPSTRYGAWIRSDPRSCCSVQAELRSGPGR